MAVFHFATDYFAIDVSGTPVDLSTYVKGITINAKRIELDASAAGDVGISRVAGLWDWSMELEVYNDFAASKVDATLFAIIGVEGTVSFRPTSAAQSATNPTYAGEGIVFDYPLTLRHGEMAMVNFTIMGSDGAAMTRTAT